ncbi:MAG: hypothetical protein HQ472_08935 [Ignavibacteria bacterium]|nr:hypothetical protein [Ignavibacteria bacterium]
MKALTTTAWLSGIMLMISACTVVNQRAPIPTPKTQLQIRELQTREFDTNDVKLILKAVLNVLQDDDFVVKNAVPDLGLLTATKELQLTDRKSSGTRTTTNSSNSTDYWLDVLDRMFGKTSRTHSHSNSQTVQERFNKFKMVEVSINISEIGSRCKVRANFQAKILDNQGEPVEVYTIDDPKFYQDFFVKVDKGIFIQKQGF